MDHGWKTCSTASISWYVITDDYSRYPIVEIITSSAAKFVIPAIDEVFEEVFGVQHTLKNDIESLFRSDDFAKFAMQLPWIQTQSN